MEKKTKILVLAAGKGTRMDSEMPKVLVPLNGKPLLGHLLGNIAALREQIGLVVGFGSNEVREMAGEGYSYYRQKEQKGTGHAVGITRDALEKEGVGRVVVLYGDHPFTRAASVQRIIDLAAGTGAPLCMMTVKVPDFEGWHEAFYHWGRILRDDGDNVVAIREFKDCLPEETQIQEVNPGMYCFDAAWLWKNLAMLKNDNVQGEYYLTDLAETAISQGHAIPTSTSSPEECIGINSPEELELAQTLLEG